MPFYWRDSLIMQTTIVIPCYNEAERLNKAEFLAYLRDHADVQFLFVNDGSRDNTLEVLQAFSEEHPQVQYLDVQPNGGKAEAVRRGMLHAAEHFQSDYIGFWDADLATPLYEIDHFLANAQRKDFDVVTGLRLARLGAEVRRKNLRHYIGRCFATVASSLLRIPVYDTQCGSKLYKSNVVKDLFTDSFVTRWLFDVEILARYKQQHGRERALTLIYEYPLLAWEDVNGSKLKITDFLKAPFELLKIRRKYLRHNR